MKIMMITGGLLGFSLGAGLGLAQGCSGPALLWRASVAAFASGMLLRWWGGIWFQGLRQAYAERLAAEENAESENQSTQTKS